MKDDECLYLIDSHARVFNSKFKSGAADRGFYDGDIIERLEGKYKITITMPHKKDRGKVVMPHKKRLYNKRSAVEAKLTSILRFIPIYSYINLLLILIVLKSINLNILS